MRSQFRSEDIIRDGEPNPCPECPEYKTCRKLCQKVEWWVSQDHVGQSSKEILQNFDLPMNYNSFLDIAYHYNKVEVKPCRKTAEEAWKVVVGMKLPKKSFEFAELYYHQGKTLTEVAKVLKISAQAMIYRRQKLMREIKSRLQRAEIWKKLAVDIGDKQLTPRQKIQVMYFRDMIDRMEIAKIMGYTYGGVHGIIKEAYIKYLDK